MCKLIFATLLLSYLPALALQSEDTKTKQRINELEKTVQTLQEKVQKLESTLTKGGGFMIVATYTCSIETPFNGTFSATELTEAAARLSATEQCKAKADQGQCGSFALKCGK